MQFFIECDVCNGTGQQTKVSGGYNSSGAFVDYDDVECHECEGKAEILLTDDCVDLPELFQDYDNIKAIYNKKGELIKVDENFKNSIKRKA
tara:strand:+ start:1776 stop:2048 length:273 start_codon:yes stop_codon:yes gene_type:complete